MHALLVHREGDTVGVAIRNIAPGEVVGGLVLDGGSSVEVTARAAVSLGHKIALAGATSGSEIIEYGIAIGEATTDIQPGDHVHVHNLRSIRWREPVATQPAPAVRRG